MRVHCQIRFGYRAGVTQGEPVGLRERKRARTRSLIQREALRLFHRHGFAATTVQQIAEAAEVSPSTVFRYFPTKDDLLALDDHFPLTDRIVPAFRRQPSELGVVRALRETLREVYADLHPEDRAARSERDLLLLQVPELWTANLALLGRNLDQLDDLFAARTGRSTDDPAVRTLTGAVLGVGVRVLLEAARTPRLDPVQALDDALALLEDGPAL
jgi:AcrR family transcriptional regulator